MDETTRSRLAEINRAFYARFADDFDRSRRSWPIGFDLILPYLRDAANVLDIGCGNGRLLSYLADKGWRGRYLGLDSNAALLAVARAACAWPEASFMQADLLDAGWPEAVRGFTPDCIAGLAVLHHIPGAEQRGRLVARCAQLLLPGGLLILSTWQFLTTPRLRARILPWAVAGLRDEDVEPDDYLLSWGTGATGQRYCAAIGETALCQLAHRAGLETVETFYADGHERNLNLYGVFRKP